MSDGAVPAVFEDKCPTCIFRPGNPMHLRDGALKNVVDGNIQLGTLLVCHETTFGQADREVMCRGFFDAYGPQTSVYQIMERFNVEFEVVPNGPEATT